MATTQRNLERIQTNLDESIGYRQAEAKPQLSPVPSPQDVGRRPLRNAARIQVEQVIPDPSQPRTVFSPESIERLAKSIQDKGQLAPIRVRWSAEHKKWLIVCGERRWRAVREAALKTIDCCFVDGELSEAETLEQQMVENLLREDLSPIEQARGFGGLMELHGWNGKQVAESLHIPASTVSRALALLDLPADIQGRVDAGELAARSAYEISKVNDTSRQRDLAGKVANGMSLKQTQAAVRKRALKPRRRDTQKRLEFFAENGWKLVAIAPKDAKQRTYHHLKEALDHVSEDVQTRIDGNIRIA
jgi:ParB family chromosome partitioning protein